MTAADLKETIPELLRRKSRELWDVYCDAAHMLEYLCWRDMDEAPTDGTQFLGYFDNGEMHVVAIYGTECSREMDNEKWAMPFRWMPLPPEPAHASPPPAVEGEGREPKRPCTCVGSCKGSAGLGEGWQCVLEMPPEPAPVKKGGTQQAAFQTMEECLVCGGPLVVVAPGKWHCAGCAPSPTSTKETSDESCDASAPMPETEAQGDVLAGPNGGAEARSESGGTGEPSAPELPGRDFLADASIGGGQVRDGGYLAIRSFGSSSGLDPLAEKFLAFPDSFEHYPDSPIGLGDAFRDAKQAYLDLQGQLTILKFNCDSWEKYANKHFHDLLKLKVEKSDETIRANKAEQALASRQREQGLERELASVQRLRKSLEKSVTDLTNNFLEDTTNLGRSLKAAGAENARLEGELAQLKSAAPPADWEARVEACVEEYSRMPPGEECYRLQLAKAIRKHLSPVPSQSGTQP